MHGRVAAELRLRGEYVQLAAAGAPAPVADVQAGVVGNVASRERLTLCFHAGEHLGGDGDGVLDEFLGVLVADLWGVARDGFADAGGDVFDQHFACLCGHVLRFLSVVVNGGHARTRRFPAATKGWLVAVETAGLSHCPHAGMAFCIRVSGMNPGHGDAKGQRLSNATTILMTTKATKIKMGRTMSLPAMVVSIVRQPASWYRMRPMTGITSTAGISSQADTRTVCRSHLRSLPSGEIWCSRSRKKYSHATAERCSLFRRCHGTFTIGEQICRSAFTGFLGLAADGGTDDERHDDAGRKHADGDVQVAIGLPFLGNLLLGVLSSISLSGNVAEQGDGF